jgi:hypothetical protein
MVCKMETRLFETLLAQLRGVKEQQINSTMCRLIDSIIHSIIRLKNNVFRLTCSILRDSIAFGIPKGSLYPFISTLLFSSPRGRKPY